MFILFEVFKFIFLAYTLVWAMFFWKGKERFEAAHIDFLKHSLMVGYLFFCGLMMSYFVVQLMIQSKHGFDEKKQLRWMTNGFIRGVILGTMLSLLYIALI